eukprot:TRINITY_DN2851_c0_g1_i1.p3 TRINITY_DN2851_c0_g1~~TRINITY_DN2851_c0_g1_i1.p3  ORF type:complete len:75 (-),score=5.92 TRINITY_DN2851_c0_g1_i1:160-384(-)
MGMIEFQTGVSWGTLTFHTTLAGKPCSSMSLANETATLTAVSKFQSPFANCEKLETDCMPFGQTEIASAGQPRL